MGDTQVFMSYGNHDATLAELRAGYPKEWFPDSGGGYYRTEVNGVPMITVNTENYSTQQGAWLREQLTGITADPGYRDLPVIIQGHRPTPGTVMDGQQTSNPRLTQDLSAFPQAIYFSGHSHLNLNDPRSIHQKSFTAVNDSSSSYIEIDHGYQMLTAEGQLANRFETPHSPGRCRRGLPPAAQSSTASISTPISMTFTPTANGLPTGSRRTCPMARSLVRRGK